VTEINGEGRHDSGILDRMNVGRYAISMMNGISWNKRVKKKIKTKYLQDNKNTLYYMV
jgi:hypothetical protein